MTDCQYSGCDKPAECTVVLPHSFVYETEDREKEYCAYHAEEALEDIPGAETDD